MSNHTFEHPEMVFEKLVRHEKLVTVSYSSDKLSGKALMPSGMTHSDIYVL